MLKVLTAISLLAIAGCSEPNPETTPSSEPDPTPQVDTDPTPQTGTGGESETSSPDATINGAPGAAPMENQPTPSD